MLGPSAEGVAQLGFQAHRLDGRWSVAKRWAPTAAPEGLIDVVALLGTRSELRDQLVCEWLAARSASVILLAHSQLPGRSRLYFGRIFIAWIASSVPSSRMTVTTSSIPPSLAGPR